VASAFGAMRATAVIANPWELVAKSRILVDMFYGSDDPDGFFRLLSSKCKHPIDFSFPSPLTSLRIE